MSLNDILNLRQFNALSVCVENGEVLIHGELQETDKTCLACGREAKKPHQYYEKRVRHLSFANQPTYLLFERKDWICACGKVFLERLSFQDLRAKCTTAYEEFIYQQVSRQDISAVAAQEGLSWDIVEGLFLKGRQKQTGAFTQSGRRLEPNLAY